MQCGEIGENDFEIKVRILKQKLLMKNISLFLLLVCSALLNAQRFQLPKNCTIVKTIKGDLDKDGIDETVLVCNINQTSDLKESFGRKLFILKQNGKDLILWKENSTILRDTKDCGFCSNDGETPLTNIEIKNNTLTIVQETYNNSRRTERNKLIFRYQNNDWFLIGSTYRYWDTCDFDHRCDINFSTNQVIITDIEGDCDDVEYKKKGTSFKKFDHRFKKITLDSYKPTEIKLNKDVYFIY